MVTIYGFLQDKDIIEELSPGSYTNMIQILRFTKGR
jgi:hypothetical protein